MVIRMQVWINIYPGKSRVNEKQFFVNRTLNCRNEINFENR